MNAQLKNETLWIPTRFALQQIPGLDVDKTLSKLTTLHQQLLAMMITGTESISEEQSPLPYNSLDMFEIFAGDYFDLITPQGIVILKHMFMHNVLDFHEKKEVFPICLEEYANIDSTAEHQRDDLRWAKGKKHSVTETVLTYEHLTTLFNLLTPVAERKTKITIGRTCVTRTVDIQTNGVTGKSETTVNFYWENDSCRTVCLRQPTSDNLGGAE